MSKLTTLVCALAVMAFAAGAQAQNDEVAVDWDEAIEFAEVTDTYVENGVEWVTYYDELQGVMWSQPEDASPEAVKAYMAGDQKTLKDLGLDWICIVNWPLPDLLQFEDDTATYTYYYADFEHTYSTATESWWEAGIGAGLSDIDTSVIARVRTTSNYCGSYENRAYKPNSQSSPYLPDSSGCIGPWFGYYYHSLYDASQVENWNYGYSSYKVSRHLFYACDEYRYVRLWVAGGPE